MLEGADAMPWKRTKGGYKLRGRKRGGFVKNKRQYEKLRRKGMSKKKAARIANSRRRRGSRRK